MGKIVQHRYAAMFQADNVINLVFDKRIALRSAAIFTAVTRSLGYLPA